MLDVNRATRMIELMTNSIWLAPKHSETERVRVTQRTEACNCGCGGKDSWHAAHYLRCVRDVVAYSDVTYVSTRAYGVVACVAEATVKLPRGMTRVVFAISRENEHNFLIGWCVANDWETNKGEQ